MAVLALPGAGGALADEGAKAFNFDRDATTCQPPADFGGKFATGARHELAVEAEGEHPQVFFDDRTILDANDRTFGAAGKAGVWTEADSVTYFDDLLITPQ
jgi:hypothetical protein